MTERASLCEARPSEVSEEAWEALIRYGHHDPNCKNDLTRECFCGYTALLRSWAEQLGRPWK